MTIARQQKRKNLILLSIGLGIAIFLVKAFSYYLTGSLALKSDALESIVNIVAAVFAYMAITFANQPADKDHPYGHGKIENFSAAFEGGLIVLAAIFIFYESFMELLHGVTIKDLGLGLWINLGAGSINGVLGLLLIKNGRELHSKTLDADGHHLLTDFYTTIGIFVGLIIVKLTHFNWLDPVMAMAMALFLAKTGSKLVLSSSHALLDAEDPQTLKKLIQVINTINEPQIITVHEMRTLRSGRYIHVDLHLVVPEFYNVRNAHDLMDEYEEKIIDQLGLEGEFHTHMDPCYQLYCRQCPIESCPIRKNPFLARIPLTVETATQMGPEMMKSKRSKRET